MVRSDHKTPHEARLLEPFEGLRRSVTSLTTSSTYLRGGRVSPTKLLKRCLWRGQGRFEPSSKENGLATSSYCVSNDDGCEGKRLLACKCKYDCFRAELCCKGLVIAAVSGDEIYIHCIRSSGSKASGSCEAIQQGY